MRTKLLALWCFLIAAFLLCAAISGCARDYRVSNAEIEAMRIQCGPYGGLGYVYADARYTSTATVVAWCSDGTKVTAVVSTPTPGDVKVERAN